MTHETHYQLCMFALLVGCGTCNSCRKLKNLCGSGICVVEFNASFNSSRTAYRGLKSLEDCETARVDIAASSRASEEAQDCCRSHYRCFQRGRRGRRFQANIMMTMEATIDEVQEAVDDIMLNDF